MLSVLSKMGCGSSGNPNGFRGRQSTGFVDSFVFAWLAAQLFDNLVGRNEVIRQTF
jgi:hypothetical protein